MAAYSGILAWKIPWTEESVGYSPWGLRVRQDLTSVLECTCVLKVNSCNTLPWGLFHFNWNCDH